MKLLGRFSIASLVALVSMSAHATGVYDGIYSCNFNEIDGFYQVPSTYVTINSRAAPSTLGVFAIPYLASGQYWLGYGVGNWSGNVLSGSVKLGNTDEGSSFTATFGIGTINFQINLTYFGLPYQETGTCTQIV
jgi:hypothetical protein